MLRRCVRNERTFLARRCASGLLLLLGLLALAPQSRAQIDLGPVTVGGGLRTSYVQYRTGRRRFHRPVPGQRCPSIRERILSPTRSSSCSIPTTTAPPTTWPCLDAVARFRISPASSTSGPADSWSPATARISTGRFTPTNWNVYTDAIQNGQPSVFQGRDNGVAYWGDFGKKVKVKISAGAFDGRSADGNPDVIGAARVQFDFWDAEDGYYLNGTYYGDKNLLAIGVVDPGSIRQYGDHHRFPARKETGQRRRVFDRIRVCQLQRAGRILTGRFQEPGRIRSGKLPLSETGRHGQVRDPRQVCQCGVHGASLERQPEDHRSELQLRHQAVQRPHRCRSTRTPDSTRLTPNYLAGGNRPPGPDVRHLSSTSE